MRRRAPGLLIATSLGACGGDGGGGDDGPTAEAAFGDLRGRWALSLTGSDYGRGVVEVGPGDVPWVRLELSSAPGGAGRGGPCGGAPDLSARLELVPDAPTAVAMSARAQTCDGERRFGDLDEVLELHRVMSAESAHGDLAGDWEIRTASRRCRIVVEAGRFAGACTEREGHGGDDDFVFNGMVGASRITGSDDRGFAFDARREGDAANDAPGVPDGALGVAGGRFTLVTEGRGESTLEVTSSDAGHRAVLTGRFLDSPCGAGGRHEVVVTLDVGAEAGEAVLYDLGGCPGRAEGRTELGRYTVEQTSRESSIVGDLGGAWQLSGDDADCQILVGSFGFNLLCNTPALSADGLVGPRVATVKSMERAFGIFRQE